MIFNCKIKIKNKNNEILIVIFSRTHEIFDNKNHVTLSYFSDEISIDQNSVFSSMNMIIVRKTIFVLDAVFQIIQLETVNSHSTLNECL